MRFPNLSVPSRKPGPRHPFLLANLRPDLLPAEGMLLHVESLDPALKKKKKKRNLNADLCHQAMSYGVDTYFTTRRSTKVVLVIRVIVSPECSSKTLDLFIVF